jgi:hypothetical protein
MADMLTDPYIGANSEKERQAVYKRLQAKYIADVTAWEREQKEVEHRKSIYAECMKIWDHQRDIQKDLDARSHKGILTIASGSFGVSFAFISQIVPLDKAGSMAVLVAAWALFGLAIVLSLFELKIGSVIQDMLLDTAERNIERGYSGKPYEVTKRWVTMVPERIIGWLAFIAFVAGVVCLLYFVLANTALR